MKVLQTCPKLNQGGVERGTIEFANYLSEQGIKNYICSYGGRLVKELDNTVHYKLSVHNKNPFNIAKNAFKMARYLRQEQIDIVHARSRAPAWVAYFACKLAKVKYVTTYHGAYSHENCFKRAYSWPMRAGDRIAVISDYIRQHLKDVYNTPDEKMHTAYRCYNQERFNLAKLEPKKLEEIKKKYNLKENETVLCIVGRLSKTKGHVELVQALAKIKDERWQLLIVGDGDKRVENKIKELMAEHSLEDKIILTGNQLQPEYFYAAADIGLSLRITPEAFGRTPLEAQALEKIVIATNQGGHLETVKHGETGYHVQFDDINDWADKIKIAINLPAKKRQQMGKNAKKWVESKYTLEKMCQAELDMYKDVLK